MATTQRSDTWLSPVPQVVLAISFFCLLPFAQIVQAEDATFEYQGIRAGMTKDAIRKHLDLDAVAEQMKIGKFAIIYRDKTKEQLVTEILEGGLLASASSRFSDKAFHRIDFYFIDQEALWRLDVIFVKPSDPPKALALDQALKQKFGRYTVKEEASTSQYGTSYTYRVIMIDDKILEQAVQRYTTDFLKKM
jgi:hypothetical protein